MEKLKGKKIVVIGGSRGAGRAIAETLLNEGADTLVVGRDGNTLADLAAAFPKIRTLKADATEAGTAEQVFADAPDAIVLAAGAVPPTQPLEQLDWEAFSVNWDTDVKAAFLLTQYALTKPVKSGTKIILISSGAAIFGSPITGGYAGAKRMQMFLANYAQDAANRLSLELRFLALAPWRLMAGTSIGSVGIPAYSEFLGLSEQDFIARMTFPQTKEGLGRAVAAVVAQPPAMEEGNVFVVSGKGLIPEPNIQKELLAGK